ncbi:MAG: tetratricopeptide repeat protein [Deltaproteobacteria bacterium]|nr:tetratricopeptide repeat protein [Deltaproteobacteria bacterium]
MSKEKGIINITINTTHNIMEKKTNKIAKRFYKRKTLCAVLILLVFITASWFLCLHLISHIHYQIALSHIRGRYFEAAVEHLEKASQYRADDPLIWKNLGNAYHGLSILKPVSDAFRFTEKAKHAYAVAARLNPLDAESAYGLAEQEARLKRLFPYLHPDRKDNPYEAFPFFQDAIRLRPNGILYHYAFARYLHKYKKTEALMKIVTKLARIYPSVYGYLKKEAFWSPDVEEAAKEGLKQAINEGTDIRNAHMSMSSLLAGRKDRTGAILHYQKALAIGAIDNDSANYLHLGRLYVANGQLEDAERSFFGALSMSPTKENDLEGIYNVYKKNGYLKDLYRFYEKVSKSFALSPRMDILLARSLIDLNQYNQAGWILEKSNQKEPTANACYWLAQIAEKEKDWDRMELAIQKATVLDPENSSYHLRFSRVLKRLNKVDRAEKEAGLAIRHSAKPSSGLFNHRALIRWTMKDYQGALEDWTSAMALEPKKAYFCARAAEACINLGQWSSAVEHYEKAIHLDPKNKNYRKRYDKLRGDRRRMSDDKGQ